MRMLRFWCQCSMELRRAFCVFEFMMVCDWIRFWIVVCDCSEVEVFGC